MFLTEITADLLRRSRSLRSHPGARSSSRARLAAGVIAYILKRERAPGPVTVYVSVNSVCDLACKMCDVGQRKKDSVFYDYLAGSRAELPLELFERLLREVAPSRPLISLNSTEPLLYRHLGDAIRAVKKEGLTAQVVTNGHRLRERAGEIVEAGLDELVLSLDGPPEIHDLIRSVGGCFARALEGWREVEKIKKARKLTRPLVSVNCVISGHNFDHLEQLLDSLKGLDCAEILFYHMNFVTPGMAARHNETWTELGLSAPSGIESSEIKKINPSLLAEELRRVRKTCGARCAFSPDLRRAEAIRQYYRQPERFVSGRRCYVPWLAVQVLADGRVVPLTRCFNCVLGNLHEETFSAIWNGEKARKLRRVLRASGTFPACSRCCGIL